MRDMKDLEELSREELNKILEEKLSKLSRPELIAAILMTEIPELVDVIVGGYDREDFLAALEVLERFKRKNPDDAECKRAIEFIRQSFP